MTEYTEAERAEFDKLRTQFIAFKAQFSPLADLHAVVAHFVMEKLRKERGFDFLADEARRLRARLAEIDREIMDAD